MRMRYVLVGVILGVMLTTVVVVLAGDPATPPGPPGETASYTLEDIYDRLSTGASVISDTFKEPDHGPGIGSMYTLNEIMEVAPAVTATAAISTEVRAAKTYWSLNAGEWGEQSGGLYGGCTCECDACSMNGTRWCDNGNGTVTDLLGYWGQGKCLIWAKDASWGGLRPWNDLSGNGIDAHERAGDFGDSLVNFTSDSCRLPTKGELFALGKGTEAVNSVYQRAFVNVSADAYW